jgi:CsoR family transcriptional regulator, copper-sensing transcriptional repressor
MTAAATIARPRPSRPGTGHDREIASRLRKVGGQLGGVRAMYEDGRYCLDVLDQLAAVSAATDAVAVLILQDHIRACVRDAIDSGDADDKVDELVAAIRRYVRGHGGRR